MSIVEKVVKMVKELKDDVALWLEWHIFGCVEIPPLPEEEIKAMEGKAAEPDYTYLDEDGNDVLVFVLTE